MSNAILNGLSAAVYRGLELIGASAEAARRRLRGEHKESVSWH